MKKYFSLFILFALAVLSVKAENVVYCGDAYGVAGGKAIVPVYVKTDKVSHNWQFDLQLPAGVKAVALDYTGQTPAVSAVTLHPNFEIPRFICYDGDNSSRYPAGDYRIGNIVLSIDNSVALGEYVVPIVDRAVFSDEGDVYCEDGSFTLKIQRAEVIQGLPAGYGVSIFPRVIEDGDIVLDFNYKAKKAIKSISFDVELPNGMFFVDDAEWDPSNVNYNFTATTKIGEPTFNHSLGTGSAPTTATIGVAGTYTNKSKKYLDLSDEYVPLANISACVMTAHDVDEYEWDGSIMKNGVSTIKIKNIVMEDVDGNIYSGEYYASLFLGNSSADANICIYGEFSNEALGATLGNDDVKQMLKDVASVDITGASTSSFLGALALLINGFDGNLVVMSGASSSYVRQFNTGVEWGTLCVPFEVKNGKTDTDAKYYTISQIGDGFISLKGFEPEEVIPANTPLFVNSTNGSCVLSTPGYVDMSKYTPSVDGASADGFTMKGTYLPYDLASGAGYYISNNKLYSDGAKIRPFRAYIEGAASVKSLSIFLEDETGLVDITDKFSEEDIYNLQGMKLNKTQKGVNIVGGKKVLVK
ncbi:MAG: hypothetical protein MJZ60_09775 [Bacteroidaceae bacterium]|nr:hypothetical protein [Bacteroidaceae bacterium]